MIGYFRNRLLDKKSFTHMAYSVFRNSLFSSVILFVSSIILIRALPKDDYGLYILTLAFFAFFELLLAGTDASIIRFIPTSGKKIQHQLIATVLTIKTIIMILILLALLVSYNISIELLHIPDSKLQTYTILYSIITISFVFQFMSTSITTILNAWMLYDVLFKLTIFNSLSSFFVACAVAIFHLNIWEYVLFNAVFSFVYMVLSIYMIHIQNRISYQSLLLYINLNIMKTIIQQKILSYSLPLFGVSILSYIKNYLPSFLFGSMVSLETLAVYNIFKKITDTLHKIYASFIQGLYPKLFKMIYSKSEAMNKLFWIGLILRIIIFTGLHLLYDFILSIYTIQESRYDYLIFVVLSSTFLITYFSIFSNMLIMGAKKTNTIFTATLIRTFLSLIITFLLFKYFLIKGLILSIYISSLFGLSYLVVQSKKLYDYRLYHLSYFILLFISAIFITGVFTWF